MFDVVAAIACSSSLKFIWGIFTDKAGWATTSSSIFGGLRDLRPEVLTNEHFKSSLKIQLSSRIKEWFDVTFITYLEELAGGATAQSDLKVRRERVQLLG